MSEKSGSSAPPRFARRWNSRSIDEIRRDIIRHDRCMCCLFSFDTRRVNLKRNVTLNNALAFHIAAFALTRADNNPWPNESAANNRFHNSRNHRFVVCKECYRFCERTYNFGTFSAQNSEKFAYLQTHVTAAIQFGADLSQQVAEEIRQSDSLEAEAQREENASLNHDVSFPAGPDPSPDPSPERPPSPPERPPSPVYQSDDQEELQDAFFHFGLADEGEDPDPGDSDPDYDPEPPEQENIDPFAQNHAQTVQAQWSPHKDKNYDGFKQLLTTLNFLQCVVCFSEVRDPDRKTFLSPITLWDLCEYARLHVMNSNQEHFICHECLNENMTLSENAKQEHLYYHIVRQPPSARTIIVQREFKDSGAVLRDGVNAKDWNAEYEQRFLDRDRELRLPNTAFFNFSFSTLTESSSVHLYGMKKYQLRHIFDDYVSQNLRNGSKLKKDNKFLIFMFYIRHHLAMRAMSSILNISFRSISNILEETEAALHGFIQANTSLPSSDELCEDLTTMYCRLVHMQNDPELQVIIADGGYSFLNSIGMSGTESTENWSSHKGRHLRKYMTICTSTGHILFSNTSWPGRLTDNQIMKQIFSGEIDSASSLLELIRNKKTLLICDRGFDSFKTWSELPEQVEKFPLLKVIIPVNTSDGNERYSREDVNRSRQQVTSIRDTVERVHGHQKKFLSLSHPLNFEFFKRHWLTIHQFVNAILNRFGRLNPQKPTFTDEQRYQMIHNNNMIVDTNLSDLIVTPGHDLEWKKRSVRIWREYQFDDAALLALFPRFNEMQLNALNGGSYHLRKAKAYEVQIIEYLKDRKRQLIDGGSVRSQSTVSTLNSTFSMKIQVLGQTYLTRYFGDRFTTCIRLDVPSFFSKYRKFKIAVLIRNIRGQPPQFSFGCLCSTGLRTNPCTHAIVLLFLYTYRFKCEGFPPYEQRFPA